MKKVLQARVNVLIQKNREVQQKKQKDRLFNQKQKYSYSLYEEPSKHVSQLSKQPQFNRTDQSVSLSSYKPCTTQNMQQIYKMRFNEIETKKYQKIPIEELLTEQQYYHKIIQNLTQRIDKLTLQAINNKLAKINCKKNNLPNFSRNQSLLMVNQKQNIERGKYRFQSKKDKQELNTCNKTLNYSISREQSLNLQHIAQLNSQYTFLQQEFGKYIKQGNSESNMQQNIHEIDQNILEMTQKIKERRKEIYQLNQDISSQPKQTNKTIQNQIQQIQNLIFKTNNKNKEKQGKLFCIEQKSNELLQRLQQFEGRKEQLMSQIPQQSKQSIATTAISTAKTYLKTPTSLKVKHLTTLDVQQQQLYLLKKKEVLLKSIQAQNKKWKSIYTQKMRKLVNQYSNFKQMENISSKLDSCKDKREKQMQHLKYKNNLTE